jgi:hypothetical protein
MQDIQNFQLSDEQKKFFDTFGFLHLPGWLANEVDWIAREFEAVFEDRKAGHDGQTRTMVVPFIDQREKLSTLLDHPAILAVASGLLGDDFNYAAGDGNFYVGDTNWHSDGFHDVGKFIKIALYLDEVTRDTGCLRVIPGTQRPAITDWDARNAANAQNLWGIPGSEVPAVALETKPGDIAVFNHHIMHASFGGSHRRRMFTLNLCAHCETPEEIADLKNYISFHSVFMIEHMHSDIMRHTASPERMRHLQQVMENEGHLAKKMREARAAGQIGQPGTRLAEPVAS